MSAGHWLTPFAEVHDGCVDCMKSSKRKEQEQEQEELQALTACHIAWYCGELPAASTTRQKEGITMTKMGGRNYLLGIKPIIMFVLTTFRWGS
jgi:hypothetical protein